MCAYCEIEVAQTSKQTTKQHTLAFTSVRIPLIRANKNGFNKYLN